MHPHPLVVGIALYLTLLLAGAAGLTLVEDWLEAGPDVVVELRALLAAMCLVLMTAWYVVRARIEILVWRR
jgi:hypothetical protein